MLIHLIRHSQSLNNANNEINRIEDPPLTDVGWKQTKCLEQHFKKIELDFLLSSAFRRALETATFYTRNRYTKRFIWTELHEQGGCVSGPDISSFKGEPGMSHSEISKSFPQFCIPEEIDESGWWKNKPYETLEEGFNRGVVSISKERGCHGEFVYKNY